MAKIYCIKSKKEIPKDSPRLKEKRNQGFYSLKMRDYILKVIFECPKGHLFSDSKGLVKVFSDYGLNEHDKTKIDEVGNTTVIPKSCVLSIKKV